MRATTGVGSIVPVPDRGPRRTPCFLLLLLILAAVPARAQDEFLLNDDRISRNQWEPTVARVPTGTLMAVWQDGRNGGSFEDFDIYGLTIRNAFAIGTSLNRRISDAPAGQQQADPDIAGSPAGTFFCAWVDSRLGNRDIFGAAFDSLGLPISPNLRVSESATNEDEFGPRVIPVGSDRFLVTWADGREGQGEIFGSYRTASGAAIGGNFRITSDPVPGGSFQGEPGAGANPAGLTLIVWSDGRNGATPGETFDIYGQWLDAAGNPIGGNFKVNDAGGIQNARAPAVAASASGFVVAWIDHRRPSDPGDVWAQRYGPDGTALGPNVIVNDDAAGAEQKYVRGCEAVGGALFFWEDLRGGLGIDSNIEDALVPWDEGAPGPNHRANLETPARQGNPAATWDGVEAAVVVWEDLRRGSSDVYATAVRSDGSTRGADAQLNDDAAPFDQRQPRLGKGSERYLATWLDKRSSGNDLYAQWVTAAGARDGPNQLLWDDTFTDRPLGASSVVGPTGIALAAAAVTRQFDAGEIRGFLLPVVGDGPTSSFWISDLLPSSQTSPSVAAAADGFGAVWLDSRDTTVRIYGQRLALDGGRVGVNHPVLAIDPVDPITAIDLAADPAGGYWVLYAEGESPEQHLWIVRLDSDLAAAGVPSEVGAGVAGAKDRPALAVTPGGRVEVVWRGDGANGLGQVYFQAFDPTDPASPLSPPLALGSPADGIAEATPDLASASGFTAVSWAARPGGDWGVWAQRIKDGVTILGPAVRVDQDLVNADQLDPSVGLDEAGDVITIWTDARSTSSGTDILGRVLRFTPTAASEPPQEPPPAPPAPPPTALRVGVARPNPFVDQLGVPVEVPPRAAGDLRVTVWNARGVPVRRLHEGPIAPAATTLVWDGRDDRGRRVPSGVYWVDVRGGGERHARRVVRLR